VMEKKIEARSLLASDIVWRGGSALVMIQKFRSDDSLPHERLFCPNVSISPPRRLTTPVH
jgi:hypothetical protein